jgi:hypothetical protein
MIENGAHKSRVDFGGALIAALEQHSEQPSGVNH